MGSWYEYFMNLGIKLEKYGGYNGIILLFGVFEVWVDICLSY